MGYPFDHHTPPTTPLRGECVGACPRAVHIRFQALTPGVASFTRWVPRSVLCDATLRFPGDAGEAAISTAWLEQERVLDVLRGKVPQHMANTGERLVGVTSATDALPDIFE